MDGVLLDSEPIHFASFQSTLEHHNQSLSHSDYIKHFAGRTDEEGFKNYFDFINETVDIPLIMDKKTETYLELAKDQLVGYSGIVELVKELSTHIPLALVTGSLRAEANVALEALGISECFRVKICAEDVTRGKPDPEGYLKALSMLNMDSSDCVAIEDSPSGVSAVKSAGLDCIAVTNTHYVDDLKDATLVVEHLSINYFK